MKIVVLDAETLGKDLDLSPLYQFGEVEVYANTKPLEVSERIRKAEVVLINKVRMTRETVGDAPCLRLITVAATGYDNIDLDFCRSRGIAVCNVKGYSTSSVAQVTLTMALSLATRLPSYTSYVQSGAYTASGIANRLVPPYHEISGMTWGIVGLGNIGRCVAKVATAMGCRVIATTRTASREYPCVSLKELCSTADIISIHTPLTPETRGLIGERELAWMKKNVIVVNVARGAVMDEEAAVRALETGKIGGLGIDVYTQEPFPQESPYTRILKNENAILTPHMAWGGYETRVRLLGEIVENIRAFLLGEMRNRIV